MAPKSAEAIADNLAAQTVKTGVMPIEFGVDAMYRASHGGTSSERISLTSSDKANLEN